MKKWRATYVSFTYEKDRMATDGRASPYKNRNYHMETKGAPIIIASKLMANCVRRKEHTYLIRRARIHFWQPSSVIYGVRIALYCDLWCVDCPLLLSLVCGLDWAHYGHLNETLFPSTFLVLFACLEPILLGKSIWAWSRHSVINAVVV